MFLAGLRWNSLTSGPTLEMCLRSSLVKGNLEIPPLSLSFSSRISGGRGREYWQEVLGSCKWVALGTFTEHTFPVTPVLATGGKQVHWREVQGSWGMNLVSSALDRSLHLFPQTADTADRRCASSHCEYIALLTGVLNQDHQGVLAFVDHWCDPLVHFFMFYIFNSYQVPLWYISHYW